MKDLRCLLPFTNICIGSGDIEVLKMTEICKWDDWWHHTLNQILHLVYKQRYLRQFAAKTIKTWRANSSKCNIPTALTWQPTLFQSLPVKMTRLWETNSINSSFLLEKQHSLKFNHSRTNVDTFLHIRYIPSHAYPLSEKITFCNVEYCEIERVVKSLANNKAPGTDKIL